MKFNRQKPRTVPSRRRGIALILVLGMLAITVAVSYAMMRSQVQTTLLQNNSQTNVLARQAAEAGLLRAIRKMRIEGEWGGVDSTMTGNVDSQSSYSVAFTAGDASLTSGDPNYSQFPYRVTIVSTGTAYNSGNNTLPTIYTMSAVLQLVRRAFNTSAIPSRWNELNGYTWYQWNPGNGNSKTVDLDLPIQIQGNAFLGGKLNFAQSYPTTSTTRQRYLTDLKLMKDETGVDYRPFTGNVVLGASWQNASTSGELSGWLGVTVSTATPIGGNPWAYVSAPNTYQLYSGGPTYTVGNLSTTFGTSLTGQVITPSVTTNPLGIYKVGNDIQFRAGTKFTGILFADSNNNLTLNGSNTELNGLSLSLDGDATTYQMPVLMENNELIVEDGTNTTVNGLMICWNRFVLKKGTQDTVFNLQGRLFADEFKLDKRTEWDNMALWGLQYTLFGLQTPLLVKYYPKWIDQSFSQLKMQPKIVFQPPSNITYHWPDWNQPIYTKGAGDSGLRWNVVSWKDGS